MNTTHEISSVRFWMWIGAAFIAGIVMGVVVAIGGLIVLQAMIS